LHVRDVGFDLFDQFIDANEMSVFEMAAVRIAAIEAAEGTTGGKDNETDAGAVYCTAGFNGVDVACCLLEGVGHLFYFLKSSDSGGYIGEILQSPLNREIEAA
jgi:hypothetical protein